MLLTDTQWLYLICLAIAVLAFAVVVPFGGNGKCKR